MMITYADAARIGHEAVTGHIRIGKETVMGHIK
jgi:hypothetical protein